MDGAFVKRHFPFRLVLTADGQGSSRYAKLHENASRAA
jgi:hypothetical protein